MNYIKLGSTPIEEDCVPPEDPDYEIHASAECERFIAQLRRTFGVEPDLAYLRVKKFSTPERWYMEVVCWYHPHLQDAVDYANNIGINIPKRWDAEAVKPVATTGTISAGEEHGSNS